LGICFSQNTLLNEYGYTLVKTLQYDGIPLQYDWRLSHRISENGKYFVVCTYRDLEFPKYGYNNLSIYDMLTWEKVLSFKSKDTSHWIDLENSCFSKDYEFFFARVGRELKYVEINLNDGASRNLKKNTYPEDCSQLSATHSEYDNGNKLYLSQDNSFCFELSSGVIRVYYKQVNTPDEIISALSSQEVQDYRNNNKRYDVKSGIIHFEDRWKDGELSSQHIVYFDNYGWDEANFRINSDGEEDLFLLKSYPLEFISSKMSTYKEQKFYDSFSMYVKNHCLRLSVTEQVMGKPCEIYKKSSNSEDKYWVWGGIILKETDEFGTTEAKSVKLNVPVPPEKLEIPKNISK